MWGTDTNNCAISSSKLDKKGREFRKNRQCRGKEEKNWKKTTGQSARTKSSIT